MTTVLGCIADDFTGATDLAGLLARSGVAVSLRMGLPDGPPRDTAPIEVIALKSRMVAVDDAVAECCAALDWLRNAGASRFYWKYCSTFDSTAAGNIGPVAEALLAKLGSKQTIYCPAFPENGRTIFMGNLFVGDVPLSESPMKDHPLTPMRDSNLMRLLDPQVTQPTGLVNRLAVANGADIVRARLDALAGEGVAHVVVDAVADSDLKVIAQACSDMPLMTGGSAVAMPLPDIYRHQGLLSDGAGQGVMPVLPAGAICLAGSASAMTRAQVAQYSRDAPAFRLDPIDLAENGLKQALTWLNSQSFDQAPLIYATAEPDEIRAVQDKLGGVARAGQIVENAIAQIAIAARDRGIRRFIVAGGETSGAVTQALGVTQLDVRDEIAPGVPWCFAKCDQGHDIAITLKSGNFGAPSFFSDAQTKLDAM